MILKIIGYGLRGIGIMPAIVNANCVERDTVLGANYHQVKRHIGMQCNAS